MYDCAHPAVGKPGPMIVGSHFEGAELFVLPWQDEPALLRVGYFQRIEEFFLLPQGADDPDRGAQNGLSTIADGNASLVLSLLTKLKPGWNRGTFDRIMCRRRNLPNSLDSLTE